MSRELHRKPEFARFFSWGRLALFLRRFFLFLRIRNAGKIKISLSVANDANHRLMQNNPFNLNFSFEQRPKLEVHLEIARLDEIVR